MYCAYCGKEIENNSKFCCHCGNEVSVGNAKPVQHNVKEKIFAYIGFGLGIQALVFSVIPFLCFYSYLSCIPGIIFSNKGMNSSKLEFAKKGRLFNKLAFIFGPIMSVITVIIIAIIANYY